MDNNSINLSNVSNGYTTFFDEIKKGSIDEKLSHVQKTINREKRSATTTIEPSQHPTSYSDPVIRSPNMWEERKVSNLTNEDNGPQTIAITQVKAKAQETLKKPLLKRQNSDISAHRRAQSMLPSANSYNLNNPFHLKEILKNVMQAIMGTKNGTFLALNKSIDLSNNFLENLPKFTVSNQEGLKSNENAQNFILDICEKALENGVTSFFIESENFDIQTLLITLKQKTSIETNAKFTSLYEKAKLISTDETDQKVEKEAKNLIIGKLLNNLLIAPSTRESIFLVLKFYKISPEEFLSYIYNAKASEFAKKDGLYAGAENKTTHLDCIITMINEWNSKGYLYSGRKVNSILKKLHTKYPQILEKKLKGTTNPTQKFNLPVLQVREMKGEIVDPLFAELQGNKYFEGLLDSYINPVKVTESYTKEFEQKSSDSNKSKKSSKKRSLSIHKKEVKISKKNNEESVHINELQKTAEHLKNNQRIVLANYQFLELFSETSGSSQKTFEKYTNDLDSLIHKHITISNHKINLAHFVDVCLIANFGIEMNDFTTPYLLLNRLKQYNDLIPENFKKYLVEIEKKLVQKQRINSSDSLSNIVQIRASVIKNQGLNPNIEIKTENEKQKAVLVEEKFMSYLATFKKICKEKEVAVDKLEYSNSNSSRSSESAK
ncbi:hypothetical protein BN1013_00898 [Candidatus Rubidus massiliensis]|nr:hypothetical protein BN1013_00898 [Candidatus Rubidus massiliensis]